MKILVVEDDEVTLKALEYRLKLEGYDIVVARDGRKGAEIVKSENFDMIISDILMPHTNGLELLSMVRHEMGLTIPIIIISFLGQSNNTLKAKEIGATDFLEKPLDPDELIQMIVKYQNIEQ